MARHRAKLANAKWRLAWGSLPIVALIAASLTSVAPSIASDQGISLYVSAPKVQGSHATQSVLREDFNTAGSCTAATGIGPVTLSGAVSYTHLTLPTILLV